MKDLCCLIVYQGRDTEIKYRDGLNNSFIYLSGFGRFGIHQKWKGTQYTWEDSDRTSNKRNAVAPRVTKPMTIPQDTLNPPTRRLWNSHLYGRCDWYVMLTNQVFFTWSWMLNSLNLGPTPDCSFQWVPATASLGKDSGKSFGQWDSQTSVVSWYIASAWHVWIWFGELIVEC